MEQRALHRLNLSVVAMMISAGLLGIACAPAAAGSPTPGLTAVPTAVPPSPTATDSGPVDAARTAFDAAAAARTPAQLNFLACIVGGSDANQFSVLFSGLTELALASSGINPDEYWAAFATSFSDLEAVERSRSDDQAVVHVTFRVTITPDIAALRILMRRNLEQRGEPPDDAAIDELIDRLAGPMRLDEVVDRDVDVLRSGAAWRVCGEPDS